MQIFINTLKQEAPFALNVNPNISVSDLKHLIECAEALPSSLQILTFNGMKLKDEATLIGARISNNSTINLVACMDGGGKKRKKKVYTTPKKVKGQKKKVKLRILKYYKVDDNGKVIHLRRECNSPTCGAAVFMGDMKTFLFCGKCGATLKLNNSEAQEKASK